MTELTTSAARPTTSSGARLGDRLRLLRVAAGMTQTELAGDRFSKEYVSQIERGKTRPTADTIAWLASRLEVDATFLTSGVSNDERGRVEAQLARAEALTQAHRYKEAIGEYEDVRSAVGATNSGALDVRSRAGEAWARMEEGDPRTAIQLLNEARAIAESDGFSDVDRGDLVFRLGVCRYKLSSIGTAIALFDEALALAERSELPCDVLRADIFQWRSRCHRRQRDYEAAREDVERALELAEAVGDRSMTANGYFQASLVAERTGHWLLSRTYAEKAKALYQELNDERTVGRLMNNLGGLNLLLGKPQEAIEQLKAAFAVAVEVEAQADAAVAVGGLAAVHLELGDWQQAEEHAREALRLLDGRVDFLVEVGQSQIILGRSLLERDRLDEAEECFRAADTSFEQLSSIAHRAGAWVALGDLAARRGDDAEAARRYRNAAEALQEIRF